MKRRIYTFLVVATLFVTPVKSYALGECGLSCCLLSAADGISQSDSFAMSLQFEYMKMKTLLNGTNEKSPNEVIKDKLGATNGATYKVPTEMIMKKYNLLASYPVSDKLVILGTIPYLVNDMNMRMGMRMMGNIKTSSMSMDTISGIGDISIVGLYTVYEDAEIRPTKRVTLGLGLKMPTGKNNTTGSDGKFIHAMMQAGSGSWDPIFVANFYKFLDPIGLQANFLYQLTTEGDEGYEFGNQFAADIIAAYQASDFVNLKLGLNTVITESDKDHDGKYSNRMMSMLDNTNNTGITSVSLSPAVQVKIPDTPGSMEVRYQFPIYQDADGVQQVMDWRLSLSVSMSF